MVFQNVKALLPGLYFSENIPMSRKCNILFSYFLSLLTWMRMVCQFLSFSVSFFLFFTFSLLHFSLLYIQFLFYDQISFDRVLFVNAGSIMAC